MSIEEVPPPRSDEPQSDPAAKQEDLAFANYERAQRGRRDQFWKHVHYIALAGIWVGSILALILVLTTVWHMIGPEEMQWLDENAVQRLLALLSGAGAAVIFRLLRNYVNDT